ncbi:acyl carrier protein [Lentzea sp. NPDC058450]|uniref:acyl carrier protein n=1 Tax=Lentzea sp. NPDC058450 TaxID=3346505 RepID=UPI003664F7AB
MDDESVREAVHGILRHMSHGDSTELSDDARIATDLGFDSLRLLELAIVIEERFELAEVNVDEALGVSTVRELVDLVTERVTGTAA